MGDEFYKVILIDSTNRDIRLVEINKKTSELDLQALIEGRFGVGFYLKNKDLIYVNEEGLSQGFRDFFYIKGFSHPYVGNGVVVAGNGGEDISSTVEEIKARVEFLTPDEVNERFLGKKI